MTVTSQEKLTAMATSRLMFLVLATYFASFIFEGALRYALTYLGLPSLLYLRDTVPIIAIAAMIWRWALGKAKPMLLLLLLFVLTFHFLIGTFYLGNIFQQAFGFKMFLPMILGTVIGSAAFSPREGNTFHKLVGFAFVLSLAGLAANWYYVFPWEGADFETSFGITQQSRDWTADGVRRISGFSRASFDAASLLLICTVILWARCRNTLARLFIWSFGIAGAALTTSKGAVLAIFVFGTVAFVSCNGHRRLWLKFSLIASLLVVLVTPYLSLAISVAARAIPESLIWWTSSFVERMESMWPRAFALLLDKGNLFFGRGLGGIGSSQRYGEWWLSNAGDNLFVYWIVTFGLLGFLYIVIFVNQISRWRSLDDSETLLIFGLLLSTITYGLTANVIEQPLMSAALGYGVAKLFTPTRRELT